MKQDYENSSQIKSNRENELLREISSWKADLEKALSELASLKRAKELLERENSSLEAQVEPGLTLLFTS